jgi:hypothetical protein
MDASRRCHRVHRFKKYSLEINNVNCSFHAGSGPILVVLAIYEVWNVKLLNLVTALEYYCIIGFQ